MLSSMTPDHLLTEKEAAPLLRVSVSTLRSLRTKKRAGQGPKFVQIGRRRFYRVKDLIEFIEKNTVR